MKLALIGVGQAGGKLVDAFLEYEAHTGTEFIVSAHAINTASADLRGLDRVPSRNRILLGQSRVKGHGVGADNELAAEIADEDMEELTNAFDTIPVHEIDGFLIVAGLGGGTGSGVGPVVARQLQRIYTEPVYGLGVLPAADEGGLYALNAARSLQTYVNETDSLLLFDNDAWRTTGDSVQAGYDRINQELVRRFGVLLSAGELATGTEIGQSVVDASEVINTLGGIATIGYARSELQTKDAGLLDRFQTDPTDDFETDDATTRITSLVRQAALSQLTLPCRIESTERALVVASGPPDELSRKGIERGRQWLEDETGCLEVRGGDYPLPNEDAVAVVVLLAGVTDVPRIDALQENALEAKESIDARETREESDVDAFIDDDDVDALF